MGTIALTTAVIAAEQLTKWYGPRLAVDRVSLAVGPGEIVGLLGPNGSGKTTILRILAGYLRPSAGTARISGLDVVDDALASRRRVGYVPEDAPLYGGMTVREFLAFMGRGQSGSAATQHRQTRQSDHSNAHRLGNQIATQPQLQVCARADRGICTQAETIARIDEPRVIRVDEPTNGLDPRQIIEMRELIRSLGGERTILVTSHILGEIERVADRVAILLDGRLLGVHALRAPSEGQRLRLHVRGHEAGVRACLARVPGVTAVGVEGTSATSVATYVVDAEQAVAETLAAALIAGGFGLLAMEPAPVDLETLFLRLTGDREAATR